jgi:hypothetical protein
VKDSTPTGGNDFDFLEWLDGHDDRLVARLRELRFTDAPDELRERCWEQLQPKIHDLLTAPEQERG